MEWRCRSCRGASTCTHQRRIRQPSEGARTACASSQERTRWKCMDRLLFQLWWNLATLTLHLLFFKNYFRRESVTRTNILTSFLFGYTSIHPQYIWSTMNWNCSYTGLTWPVMFPSIMTRLSPCHDIAGLKTRWLKLKLQLVCVRTLKLDKPRCSGIPTWLVLKTLLNQ